MLRGIQRNLFRPVAGKGTNTRARDRVVDKQIDSDVTAEYSARLKEAQSGAIDGRSVHVRQQMEAEIARRKADPHERTKAWNRAINNEIRRQVEAEFSGRRAIDGASVVQTRRRQRDPAERKKAAQRLINAEKLPPLPPRPADGRIG